MLERIDIFNVCRCLAPFSNHVIVVSNLTSYSY